MKVYTVHHRSAEPDGILNDPDTIVFVKEGFCWPGLFVPALWMLFKGMWLVLLLYLAVMIVLNVVFGVLPIEGLAPIVIVAVGNVIIGFEGNDLYRWTLARRGLSLIDVVGGRDREEAERRYFTRLTAAGVQAPASEPVSRSIVPKVARRMPGDSPKDAAFGLWPDPGSQR